MTLTEEKVQGYEAFKTKIGEIKNKYSRIFVIFTGSKENTGRMSWCPDCNDFDAVLTTFRLKHKELGGHLLWVDVGNRDEWKDKASPFRTDPLLRISSIPTLMEWGTPKKLSNELILKEDALQMLFLDED